MKPLDDASKGLEKLFNGGLIIPSPDFNVVNLPDGRQRVSATRPAPLQGPPPVVTLSVSGIVGCSNWDISGMQGGHQNTPVNSVFTCLYGFTGLGGAAPGCPSGVAFSPPIACWSPDDSFTYLWGVPETTSSCLYEDIPVIFLTDSTITVQIGTFNSLFYATATITNLPIVLANQHVDCSSSIAFGGSAIVSW